MISALLLCAGKSQRMGRTKALLPLGGESLLHRSLRALNESSHIEEILCVTGADRENVELEIRRFSDPRKIKIVFNGDFALGIGTSIKVGVRALSGETAGFFILPVDLPGVLASDFECLLNEAQESKASLVRFRYNGQPAHPVFIGHQHIGEILTAPQDPHSGLGYLFETYAERTRWIDTDSDRGAHDLDTLGDYHAYISP